MHLVVDHDRSLAADLQSFYRGRNKRVGAYADRYDHEVHRDSKRFAFYGNRRTTSRLIGFAQLHHLQHRFADTSVLVGMVFERVMQGHELYSFLLGMLDFLHTRRHLLLATAVDNHRVLSAETFSRADSIHGGVATTDNRYVLTIEQGCVGRRIGSVHEVHAGEVFVTGEHTVQVLSGDIHESRQSGSRADEDTFEALLLQLLDRDCLADDGIGMELHAERTQAVNLFIDDGVRETELRNTILEHPAYLMQRFEDVYLVAVFGGIACEGQSGRTGAHNGDFRRCI